MAICCYLNVLLHTATWLESNSRSLFESLQQATIIIISWTIRNKEQKQSSENNKVDQIANCNLQM